MGQAGDSIFYWNHTNKFKVSEMNVRQTIATISSAEAQRNLALSSSGITSSSKNKCSSFQLL